MNLPPTTMVQAGDFHNAWATAVRYVLRNGRKITIGDASDPKPIRDACVLFGLTGDAIRQIEDHELHPQFPFRHIDQYCEMFTREYQKHYQELPKGEKFTYTYFDRLTNYDITRMGYTIFAEDQLKKLDQYLSMQIHDEISSNRDQAITWRVDDDLGNKSPPCLQRIWIRYLGDRNAEVHLTWRSRDLYTAWQANIIALIDMLNREVIKPNDCKIVKIVDYIDSLHIYESDVDAAKNAKLVPVMPGNAGDVL